MSGREHLVYTDGSAKAGEGGPGGWGYCIKAPNRVEMLEAYGKAMGTQAKVMEYRAVAEAIAALPDGATALVFSDNMPLVENLTKKLDVWRHNGFSKVDPLVLDSVRSIATLSEEKNLKLRYEWVRGHNGNAGNERADALAAQGAREAKAELRR